MSSVFCLRCSSRMKSATVLCVFSVQWHLSAGLAQGGGGRKRGFHGFLGRFSSSLHGVSSNCCVGFIHRSSSHVSCEAECCVHSRDFDGFPLQNFTFLLLGGHEVTTRHHHRGDDFVCCVLCPPDCKSPTKFCYATELLVHIVGLFLRVWWYSLVWCFWGSCCCLV